MKVPAFALLFLSVASNAETRLHVGAWSTHLFNRDGMNETHDLVAIEHRQVMVGTFSNSYGEESWFGGYRLSRSEGHFQVSAIPGLVYGYRDCFMRDNQGKRRWCPSLILAATWTQYRVEPSLMLNGGMVAGSFALRW